MKLIKKNFIRLDFLLLSFIILLGFYFCLTTGYGSDEDTLPMLNTFMTILNQGSYASSRFQGYIVPEIGLGFLAYHGGSALSNSVNFLLYLSGLFFLVYSFKKKYKFGKDEITIFFILVLSNPLLLFDNLETIDYPWSIFFISFGLFCLSKNWITFAIISFGYCIGARMNFAVFIIPIIYFYDYGKNLNFYKRSIYLIAVFLVGGLFYLPVWIYWKFKLDFLSVSRPMNQGFLGLFGRFFFKSIESIGFIQSLIIILFLFKNKFIFKNKFLKDNKLLISLILINLVIYIYIPDEKSYLQIFLLSMMLLVIKYINRKIVYLIIILNLTTWFIKPHLLDIKYIGDPRCGPKEAIDAKLNVSLKKGYLYDYIDTRKNIYCWVFEDSGKAYEVYGLGKPLKFLRSNK